MRIAVALALVALFTPALADASTCPGNPRLAVQVDCSFEVMGLSQRKIQHADSSGWKKHGQMPRVTMKLGKSYRLSAEVGCSRKNRKDPWKWNFQVALRKSGQGAEPVRLGILEGLDWKGMAKTGKPLSVTSYHFFQPAIMFSGMKATRLDYVCRLKVRPRQSKR